jgi:hypothetical protein
MLAGCAASPTVVLEEKNGRWTFETEVKFPSRVDVFTADKTLVLTFEFAKMEDSADSTTPEIKIKNSSDRPLSLSYKILGYDDKQSKMSEANDTVVIRAGEYVSRQLTPTLMLSTFEMVPRFG